MPETLGEWIKRNRKSRGWSQRVLAEKTGLTDEYISMLETGKRPGMSSDGVKSLADAFGTDPNPMLSLLGFQSVEYAGPDDKPVREIIYEREPSDPMIGEGHIDDDDPLIRAAQRAGEAAYKAAYKATLDELESAMRGIRSVTTVGFGKDRYDAENEESADGE